jgi:hypothetical protein
MEKEFIIKHLQFYGIPCYDMCCHNTVIQIICGAEFLDAWRNVLKTVLPKYELTAHEISWPYMGKDGIVKYDTCYSILVQ